MTEPLHKRWGGEPFFLAIPAIKLFHSRCIKNTLVSAWTVIFTNLRVGSIFYTEVLILLYL